MVSSMPRFFYPMFKRTNTHQQASLLYMAQRTLVFTILFHAFGSTKNFVLAIPNYANSFGFYHLNCVSGKYHLYKHRDSSQQKVVRWASICSYAFLSRLLAVSGDTYVSRKVSVISSTRRTETPARYISIRMPLNFRTFSFTSPAYI